MKPWAINRGSGVRSVRRAFAVSIVVVTVAAGGTALAHHREGHGGGPKPTPTASPTPSPSPTPEPSPSLDADVAIRITDEPDPYNGLEHSHVTYTIDVTNHGPGSAHDVIVTSEMQVSGRLFGSPTTSQGTCAYVGESRYEVRCELGSLEPGATGQVTLKAVPCSDFPMVLEARVESSQDPESANDSATEVTALVPLGYICSA